MRRALVFTSAVVLGFGAFAYGCGGDDNTGAPKGPNNPDGSTSGDSTVPPGTDSGMNPMSDAPSPSDSPVSHPEGSPGPDASPGTGGFDVVQHHRDGYRSGLYVDPTFTKAAAATTHIVMSFAATVNGNVRAQPLYVESGPGQKEAFIVATENNHVSAIDTMGTTLWDKGYGTQITGNLPCGNINPLGITGTPYIDLPSRTIYFDTMATPDNNNTFQHLVYAVSLDDGTVKANWPVDVASKVNNFDARHQNQRGALQLVNGVLYVPYGGHDGDCDPYFGWVIGVPVANPQQPTGWHTQAARGGIWGTGALPTDGTSVFPVTGNTEGTAGTWGGGEAVIRLTSGPAFSGNAADYYAPMNWEALDNADLDLGGASDFLLDMPGGAKPHWVLAPGKDQNLYVLDRDNLGGIGAELSKTHIANNEMNAAGAAYTTSMGTYAALRVANGGNGNNCPTGGNGNIVVVKFDANAKATVAWCTDEAGLGSPMVTTTDGKSNAIVWDANNHLWAYDGDTGAKIFDGSMTALPTAMHIFNSPIDAKGRIAVAADGHLYVFTP